MQVSRAIVVLLISALLISVFTETAISALQTSIPSNDDWPMFQHDLTHTGASVSAGPLQPVKLWSFAEGGTDNIFIGSSAAIANDIVYTGFNYNTTNGKGVGFYAFEALTGKQIWNFSTQYISIYSSPCVYNNLVFVGIGYVYAFNAFTGAIVWNSTISGVTYSSPAIYAGVLYVGSIDGNVYALNVSTGFEIWHYPTKDTVVSSPAFSSGVIFIGSGDGNIYAINATTGSKIWNFSTGAVIHSSPVVNEGMVFVGSINGILYSLNCSTGKEIWNVTWHNVQKRGIQASPAIADGVVYIGSYEDDFRALNASTGLQIWSRSGLFTGISSPTIASGVLYLCANNNVYALNVSTGDILWVYSTGQSIKSSPAISYGVLYVTSQDGKLYAIGQPVSESTPVIKTEDTGFWLIVAVILVMSAAFLALIWYGRRKTKKF